MRENIDNQSHSPTVRPRILQVLTFLSAFTIAPGTMTNTDASPQNGTHGSIVKKYTQEQGKTRYIPAPKKDCAVVQNRVHCILEEAERNHKSKNCPKPNDTNSEPTGETVNLGGQNFEVRQSEECGTVLKAEDGTLFAVPDLKVTTETVNTILSAGNNAIASR
jgi:hypothetical protein